ncbi:MAG: sugar phosphate nucleotidyltransferase [Candidatus Moraniibacteriota bacterium]
MSEEITKPKRRKMKGIILAGGTATRLFPMTATTSKQLLPVYDRQMIFYPLNTLIKAGIKNILVIVAPEHSGQFLNLLGSLLKKYGIHITFEVQSAPRGLAEALTLGENHIGDDNVALILGDNIFEDDFARQIKEFRIGAHLFAKKVADPERFGVVRFNKDNRAMEIVEKPTQWISDYAVTGLYLFDNECVEIAKNIKPSDRGEVEITEVNKVYLKKKSLEVTVFDGEWLDAGTPDSLLQAGIIVKEKGISKNFHPVLEQAIAEFNEELRILSKKKLK